MARTSNDLAVRALSKLGRIATGQPPAAEDLQLAVEGIAPLLAELQVRNIVYVPDADAIDDTVFNALSTLLANSIADEFELSSDSVAGMAMRAAQAESRLLAIRDDPEADGPIPAQYF